MYTLHREPRHGNSSRVLRILPVEIVELVSWLVDPPEEPAPDTTDEGTQQETGTLYIEIDRGGREFIRTSTLSTEFSFEWNFLPNV